MMILLSWSRVEIFGAVLSSLFVFGGLFNVEYFSFPIESYCSRALVWDSRCVDL